MRISDWGSDVCSSDLFDLGEHGVNLVGAIPQGLPPFALPSTDLGLIGQLWVPALLISIIGFVESVSVAQTLAAKRRQRIAPNQELIGLGASNIASALSGGYPVTGGFRSEEHTSELPSLMRISYAVFCLKKK